MNTKRRPTPPPPLPPAEKSVRYPSHRDVVAKVVLPGGKDPSHHFCFAARGNPPKPTIVRVSPDCPYDLEVGQTVCAIGIKDEFIMDPSTKFLSDVIQEFNFSDQRTLLLQRPPHHVSSIHGTNGSHRQQHSQQRHKHHHTHHHHCNSQPATRSKSARELNNRSDSAKQIHLRQRSRSAKQLGNNGRSHSAKQVRSSSAKKISPVKMAMPGPGKLSLPAGHVGLWFEGSPARLTDMSAGSPVVAEGKGKVGLVVTAILIPGEIEIYGPVSSDELVELLDEFSDCQGRVIGFDRLQNINMAKEVVSKIHLPTKMSIQFGGKDRDVKILKVDGDSRTKKKVKVGQSVRRLEFPGESPYFASVGAKTLNVILGHHEKTRGKVLVTGQPFYGSSSSTEKKALEEEEPQEKKKSKSMKDSIRSSISILKEQTKRR